MADRGSRGGGRGGRGNRGGPRGGGGQGNRGEHRGGSRGGSRGDFEGGSRGGGYRGGGRGEFRGGSRGDSRGDYRGGRGRGRGGGRGGRSFEDDRNPPIFTGDGPIPAPDPAVTAIEDQIVAQQTNSMISLVSKMGKLAIGSQAGATALSKDLFPPRPAYGSRGTPVTLWANYFRIDVKLDTLYKYNLEVKAVSLKEPEAGKSSKTASPREVKGRALYFAIREAVSELSKHDKSAIIATEFKNVLVSRKKLELKFNPLRVAVPSEPGSEKMSVYDVQFHGPVEARIADLMRHITSKDDSPAEENVFPRYPEVVDALNVVFGYGPRSKPNISAVGSSRFFSFQNGGITRELTMSNRALLAARGYFQSVRPGTGRLLINTNVTHGVFRLSGKMVDLFQRFQITPANRDNYHEMKKLRLLAKFLAKARVEVTMKLDDGRQVKKNKALHGLAMASEIRRGKAGEHPPRITQGWEFPGPDEVSFWLSKEGGGGNYITVAEHYKKKYQVQLGNYPVLNVGRADKPTYIPAEFVTLEVGQLVKAKLTGKETTEMLGFACRLPYANAFSIVNDGREALGLDDGSLNNFGVSVDKKLLTVKGRILQTPSIAYKSLKTGTEHITPKDASWNLARVKVSKPGAMINRWSYVNIGRPRGEPASRAHVEEFSGFMAGKMGIRINRSCVPPPPSLALMDLGAALDGSSLEKFFDWAQDNNVDYLLVVLWTQDSVLYGKVKTLGDCTYGIHTSCVQGDKLCGGNPGYFANVGMKWNLKAGGNNHQLSNSFGLLKEGRTMMVGYDVTHPTNMPNEKAETVPSLVGLVASIDSDLGQFPSVSWEQTSRKEMLSAPLIEAFKSRIQLWMKHNKGETPENIVIFRDGVSEGQFAQVLDQELPLIREACRASCGPKRQPRLTIIVSVKRHQTRFYPTDNEGMCEKTKNTKNGTVVDRGVTQARQWDFFLTAHSSIKGTARPAHYTVLLDEIFRAKYQAEAANELERLTHEMCYLFGRATKAVSICPPAYYADLVCTRARAHRPEHFEVSDMESVLSGGTGSTAGGGKQVHEKLKDTMYYM